MLAALRGGVHPSRLAPPPRVPAFVVMSSSSRWAARAGRALVITMAMARATEVMRLVLAVSLASSLAGCERTIEPHVVDLLAVAERTQTIPTIEGRQRFSTVQIDGISKRALFLHPVGRVSLPPVEVAVGARLEFDFALLAESWTKSGDGVRFRIRGQRVGAADTEPPPPGELLFERYIDPKADPAARRWNSASIDLPPEMEGTVRLTLETDAGPRGDAQYDWAVWSEVHLVSLPPPSRSDFPNLVVVTLDATRADHLSIYGYAKRTSPFLEELAATSTVYQRAYSTSTWSLPSHASLFTGRLPSEHGATNDGISSSDGRPLDRHAETLAEVLQRHGVVTLGVVGGPFLDRRYRLDQGFARYSDKWIGVKRRADEMNRAAFDMLERAGDRPFFLFLNYFDTHAPYDPPGYSVDDRLALAKHGIDAATFQHDETKGRALPPDVVQLLVDRYDAEIAYADSALRELVRFLEKRGQWGNTVLCVLSDHGESFGEHGLWGHGGHFFEHQARIPMVVRPRGGGSRRRVESPISILHVPSLLAAEVGIELPPSFAPTPHEGRSELIFGERFLPSKSLRMMLDFPFKYLNHTEARTEGVVQYELLFDLSTDPLERADLAASEPKMLLRMRKRYERQLAAIRRFEISRAEVDASGEGVTEDDSAHLERLRALGYIN